MPWVEWARCMGVALEVEGSVINYNYKLLLLLITITSTITMVHVGNDK